MFRLKHICSIFGIFPSHTPWFFYFGAKDFKENEGPFLAQHGEVNSDPLDHIHSCWHLAALLPKVIFPVPAENPNLLNGPERRTPRAKCGERLPESQIIHGEQEAVPGKPSGCTARSVSCPAPWCLTSTAPQQSRGAAVPPASTGASVTCCYCLSVCVFLSICVPPAHSE